MRGSSAEAVLRPRRLRQLLTRLFLLSGLIVAVCAMAGALAFVHLSHDRNLVLDRIDPANRLVSQQLSNYLDEETGVRGYALSSNVDFLQPYSSGTAGEDTQLSKLLPPNSRLGQLLGRVHADADAWTSRYAAPSVRATDTGSKAFVSQAALDQGKTLFDVLRASIGALQTELQAERQSAEVQLATATDQLATVMIVSLVVILLNGVVIWVALRRLVLGPLADVSEDARVVTGGVLDHEVRRTGPIEIAQLASDIELMRRRIFDEVGLAQQAQAELATTNAELARSNEDLEQFAYVASHDLQEPLRKVASFCQLLEQRYADKLDERGTQYIDFAVDGAKRMQVLINDLLAFSRIGRTTDRFVRVDLADSVAAAVSNLSNVIESAGADVRVEGTLPVIDGDPTLLSTLFQNLIGNAVKFHGEEPPRVTVRAEHPEGEPWLVTVADNGIGIEPRFAERIFVIFQRLHGREAYTGTGIGLALCRKIVEFHRGRIWLDTDYTGGTRLCINLPDPPPDPEPARQENHEHHGLEPPVLEPPDRESVDQAG